MDIELYARRVTTAQRDSYTPKLGALLLDTDEAALYIGDGATVGGHHTNPLRVKTISADYTLLRSDIGYFLHVDTTAGDITITLPNSTTEPKMVGVHCSVVNKGGNAVHFVSEAGATIEAVGTTLADQNTAASLYCYTADTHQLLGALT